MKDDQSSKRRLIPQLSSPPLFNVAATTVSSTGTIQVSGLTNFSGAGEIAIRVYRDITIDPTTGPDLSDSLLKVVAVSNGAFSETATNALGTIDSQVNALNCDNKVVVWERAQGQQHWSDSTQRKFRGVIAPTANVQVDARHCIWFCWADVGYPNGPFQESGDVYRPHGLVVPRDAAQVLVQANSADRWTHDADNGGPITDANGANPLGLLMDVYKTTPQYHASNIDKLTAPLNKLVGIWETGFGPPTSAQPQIEIGLSYSENFTANLRTRLFLAMHDGQEWSDNQGTVNVTVTWS